MTTARLKGPDNHGGFSHEGVSYAPDAEGLVEVPHEALEAAFSHGFTLVPGQAEGTDTDGAKPAKPLNKMSKAELVALGLTLGLELVPDSMTVKDMIAQIEAAQAA